MKNLFVEPFTNAPQNNDSFKVFQVLQKSKAENMKMSEEYIVKLYTVFWTKS